MITHFDLTTGTVDASDEASAPSIWNESQTTEARLLTLAEAAALDRTAAPRIPADLAGMPVERILSRFRL